MYTHETYTHKTHTLQNNDIFNRYSSGMSISLQELYSSHIQCTLDSLDAIANKEDLWGDAPYNGGPAWIPDDPVHLVQKLYDDAAERICAFSLADEGDEEEPMPKRQRLESVVVKVRGAQSMGPPATTAVQARPGWSSGEIVRPQSSGGRFFRGQNTRGTYRGWLRMPYRGQKRSNPY
jgi:hypothetical protein